MFLVWKERYCLRRHLLLWLVVVFSEGGKREVNRGI